MPRRRPRSSSPWLIVLLCVVALPILVAAGVWLFVDPNAFKPRIVEAVQAATGRTLAINGPISIGLSLQPTLRASDVHLSNPPGFSRPDMASLAAVEAQLSLWPLLSGRVEIIHLDLSKPDILLATNAQGVANWRFTPEARPAAPSPASAAPATPPTSNGPRFAVGSLHIDGGQLAWHVGAMAETVAIRQLTATSAGAAAAVSANADITLRGHDLALTAETGPLERLLAPDPTAQPWPLQVVARVEGARFAVSGTIERPMEARGLQLTLDASAPDLVAMGALVGQSLPKLHDISASAKLTDLPGAPELSAIALRAGASDLGDVAAGLTLERLEITAVQPDQPLRITLDAARSGARLHVAATTGAIGRLFLPPTAEPFPIDATIEAAGATLSLKGGIASPAAPSGLDLALSAAIPDLSALAPLAGRPLPALHDITLATRLSDGEGGPARTLVLRGLTLAGPFADLAGDLAFTLQPRVSVQGQLAGKHLDLDGLQAALAVMPAAPLAPVPVPVTAAAPAASTAASTPARSPAAGPHHVIPDRNFDLTALRQVDGDLRLTFGEIRSGGVITRDLAAHGDLAQGKLQLDSFAATLPGGRLEGRLSIDAAQPEPPIVLALTAPGLAIKPLLTAFGLPDDAAGTIELALDVTAAGRSPHALAATLSGKVGLAILDGEIDNRLLASTLGSVLKAARLPTDLVLSGSRTKLRCIALRMDPQRGIGNVLALVLDSPRALVQGTGVINLSDETLGLRLRPLLRTGGAGIVVPVRVVGPFTQPAVSVDGGGALEGAAAGVLGGLAGGARNPLGALTQAFSGGERGGDACGPAVAAARAARPAFK